MDVSRGSFYWHFEDLADFQERLIGHWKANATEATIVHIEQFDSPKERMDSLLRQAFGHVGRARLLYWAYLGASLCGDRLDRAPLDLMLSELGRVGFGDIAATDPGIAAKQRRLRRG